MPKKTPLSHKLAILSMIKDKKDILFGKFKTDLENQTKVKEWECILVKAKSLEMVGSGKDWKYIRDNLFGIWKSRAMVHCLLML